MERKYLTKLNFGLKVNINIFVKFEFKRIRVYLFMKNSFLRWVGKASSVTTMIGVCI